MASVRKPRVALIGCGGTISTAATSALDYIDYLDTGRKMSAEEVLGAAQDVLSFADVRPVEFRSVSSSAIGPAEWVEIAHLIEAQEKLDADLTGVVVLHGTGTLEETAYFLNLALKSKLPVALVGAQRPLNSVSTDAVINLRSAVRAVCDPQAAGCGVLVVLNDEIHQARDVTKTSTYRLFAFKSTVLGPLGVVDADRVSFYRRPSRFHTLSTPFRIPPQDASLPRVDIAYAYAGSDGAAIRAFVGAGAAGIVSAGFAPGMSTPGERAALEEAAQSGVIVVQASRAGSGRVARRGLLVNRGWLAADDLNPQKARILLMLGLTVSRDPEVIQSFFDKY